MAAGATAVAAFAAEAVTAAVGCAPAAAAGTFLFTFGIVANAGGAAAAAAASAAAAFFAFSATAAPVAAGLASLATAVCVAAGLGSLATAPAAGVATAADVFCRLGDGPAARPTMPPAVASGAADAALGALALGGPLVLGLGSVLGAGEPADAARAGRLVGVLASPIALRFAGRPAPAPAGPAAAGLAGLTLAAAEGCGGPLDTPGLPGGAALEACLRAALGAAPSGCALRAGCCAVALPGPCPPSSLLLLPLLPAAWLLLDLPAAPSAACQALLSLLISTGAQRERGS